MATIQNLSNFFNLIWLEEPDAVIVDEAADTIWRLAEAREPHPDYEDVALPDYAAVGPIPDFRKRGVCTYTPATGEAHLFRGFDSQQLDEAAYSDLHAFLADHVDPAAVHEFYIEVDQFNGFQATVPPKCYCEETDFAAFEQWIDYVDADVIDPANSEYSELLDDIVADDENSESGQ
jgi:hypothetical protein